MIPVPEALLYAFAATGVLATIGWTLRRTVARIENTRSVRRHELQRVLETIQDPEWQARIAEEVRVLVEDFSAVADRVQSRERGNALRRCQT